MRVRLKEKLANAVPTQALSKVYNAFDIIGDIAIIKTAGGNPQGYRSRGKNRL